MTVQADSLPDDPSTLKAMLIAERTQNERLRQIIKELQRHRFGRRAETLPEDQMLLGLEDVEQVAANGEAKIEAANPAERANRSAKRRTNRGSLPAHLPRIEMVVDIGDRACPCCGQALHRIGEDTGERLDMVPAQFRVLVVRRPKYACRSCENVVVQAPAPSRLIEGGLPTEATVAQVLVAKYADHLPLYRQAQIYARQGINLDRSTLDIRTLPLTTQPLPYPPPWMDAKTLAQHLSVKPSTIRLMMKRGRLPRPMQDGKVTLWNWELVNRWLMRLDGSETTAAEVTADVLAKRAKSIRRSRGRLYHQSQND